MSLAPPFVFPPFRLDAAQGQLWRETEPVPIRPKTLAVLSYLINHQGQVVSRNELRQAVWPRSCGKDYAPKQCIRELRVLLNDTASQPRFIETQGRHGYRFIGRLELSPAVNGGPSSGGAAGQIPVGLFSRPCAGRETELAQLRACLEKARWGGRPVVFVAGEPGIGKTALVDELIAGLTARKDVWIGRGQCVQHAGTGEAYQPLLDMLGLLGRGLVGDGLIRTLERYAPTWLLQLPGLVSGMKLTLLQQQTQGAGRERMLRELAEALEALATETPGVLVLEDLQWSDAATLDWLAAWPRRCGPARLLVIGTYRPVDLIVHDLPLKSVVQELRQHRQCQVLALTGLSREAVVAYLTEQLAGHAFPAGLETILWECTEGHPLFMRAVFEEWVTQGLLRLHEGQWVVAATFTELAATVPEDVRQLIDYQFDRLSLPEQAVLEAASVAGIEFSAAAVAAGLSTDLESVEACCTSLARRQVFLKSKGDIEWPDGTLAARYGFHHALYQQVVYGKLPAGRRRTLHQRIGARLEAAYGGYAG